MTTGRVPFATSTSKPTRAGATLSSTRCQGARRRMLITSANLSRAAWGDAQANGELVIDNFELGVLLRFKGDSATGCGTGRSSAPHARSTTRNQASHEIAWLAAEWDGKESPSSAGPPREQSSRHASRSPRLGRNQSNRCRWHGRAAHPSKQGSHGQNVAACRS